MKHRKSFASYFEILEKKETRIPKFEKKNLTNIYFQRFFFEGEKNFNDLKVQ